MGLMVVNLSRLRSLDPAAKHAPCLEVLYIKSDNLRSTRTGSAMGDDQGGDSRNGGESGTKVHVEVEVASGILLSVDY
jgi:hypothetical protein